MNEKISLDEILNKLKDKFNKSGFIPVDEDIAKKLCHHPEHNPPTHLHIPYMKVYKHVCPSCKRVVFLNSSETIM